MKRLVVGCGYLGSRVAAAWRDAGDVVFVTSRRPERAQQFAQQGFQPIVLDVTQDDGWPQLPVVDTVLYAVGFDRSAGDSIYDVYADGLRRLLDRLPGDTGRVIYISSTGVYGQTEGEWVDELSPCEPTREGGRACLAAERALAEHARVSDSVVLRLAGIYGPARIPVADSIRRGEPIAAPVEGYLNLIHVEDAAAIVRLVADGAGTSSLYCVSDGRPVVRRDYYGKLAELLSAPAPTFIEPAPGTSKTSRAASNKRVSNELLMQELQPSLMFPSYREGLAAAVRQEYE